MILFLSFTRNIVHFRPIPSMTDFVWNLWGGTPVCSCCSSVPAEGVASPHGRQHRVPWVCCWSWLVKSCHTAPGVQHEDTAHGVWMLTNCALSWPLSLKYRLLKFRAPHQFCYNVRLPFCNKQLHCIDLQASESSLQATQ